MGVSSFLKRERFAGTAWTQCDSWYRDEHGRIITNWPGYMREYEAALWMRYTAIFLAATAFHFQVSR